MNPIDDEYERQVEAAWEEFDKLPKPDLCPACGFMGIEESFSDGIQVVACHICNWSSKVA